MPVPPNYDFRESFEDTTITEDKEQLSRLNTNKAPGPDGIHPYVLRELAAEIAYPVCKLYNQSLEEGTLPEDWTIAIVTPIFKKGKKKDPTNYRPVSLTSVLGKVMEKLVRASIVDHLEQNNLISNDQHGFVMGRSCVTHLLEVMDEWTTALEEGSSLDVIYMDFKKAFDSVPHSRLISKLNALGVQGIILQWSAAFLTGRSQRVQVNGCSSTPVAVTSGITQESVLGPTLIVMYINDLPRELRNTVKLFVYDTELYARSDTVDLTNSIQTDLNKLQEWSRIWQLEFHPQKCNVLKLGTTTSAAQYYMQKSPKQTAY